MALGRKTGGRQKGTPNKATTKQAEEIRKSGLTPLQYLMRIVRNPKKDEAVRIEAAKAAAPYVHPRLQAVEHSGDLTIKHEQWLDKLD